MSINQVNTTISTMPEAPSILDPDNFDAKGEAFLPAERKLADELKVLVTSLQAFITQTNDTETNINESAVQISEDKVTTVDAKNVVVGIKEEVSSVIASAIEQQVGELTATIKKNAKKRKMNEFGIAL